MKVSASYLKSFMHCSLQGKYQYIDRLPQLQNAAASFGTAVHLAIELYNNTDHDVEAAIKCFLFAWDNPEEFDITPQFYFPRTSYGQYRERGVEFIRNYHENYQWIEREIIATEHRFCVDFRDNQISGVVDIIETEVGSNQLKITDLKTGKRPNKQSLGFDVQFCADEATEILTKRGWLSFEELIEGEEVLTLNQSTNQAEWQPALSVHTFRTAKQQLISYEGKAHSSLTTANHRWPVKHYVSSSKGWHIEDRIVRSEDLTGSDRIICAANVTNLPTEAKYENAFVELVGWFWTEGHVIEGGSISLAQSERVNPEYVESIRSALKSLYGDPENTLRNGRVALAEPCWRESVDSDVVRFYLNRTASLEVTSVFQDLSNKVVSYEFIANLTEEQLKLFVDISVAADGTERDGCRVVTQSCKERLDPLQMACSLLGIRTSLTEQTIGGSGDYAGRPFWRLSFKDRRPYFVASNNLRKEVEHTGTVWCPRTANQTWYARRHGQVYFTGNTAYLYAAQQKEFWTGYDEKYVGLPNGEELYERFKDFEFVGIWSDLKNSKDYPVGPRTESDYDRLAYVLDSISRAIEHEVFVPDISGDTCGICSYQDLCPIYTKPEWKANYE